ncbi:MAG: hypothetical protein ACIAQ0_12945 [Phycisphaerales bacterium JB058]
MTRLLTPIALVCTLLLVSACRSGPATGPAGVIPTGDPRPPADFALAVTVMGEEGTTGWVLEPARFVIEPDAVLRAATGAGVGPTVYPPRTRRLTDVQINDLYSIITREGLDRGVGGSPFRMGDTQPAGAWILIEVTAHEHRRSTLYLPQDERRVIELVRHLRRLARLEG